MSFIERSVLVLCPLFRMSVIRGSTVLVKYLVCCPVGTFHLIHMLMDDYLLHLLESELEKQQQRDFERKILLLRDGILHIYTHKLTDTTH